MCSELDILDPELLHSSNRTAPSPMCWEGTPHSSPSPVLSVELGPGSWVGAKWVASIVLASEFLPGFLVLPPVDYKSQNALHLASFLLALIPREVVLGYRAVPLGICSWSSGQPVTLSRPGDLVFQLVPGRAGENCG